MRTLLLFVGIGAALADDKPKPEPPRVLYTSPMLIKPGATAKLKLHGFRLDSVTDVKSSDDTVIIKLAGKGKKVGVPGGAPATRFGDTECEIEATVPADFAADHFEIVAGGTFRIAVRKDGTPEKEPNNGFAEAQPLTLPATIDGMIWPEKDVDTFRFSGKAGKKASIAIEAARFGSPAELIVTVYDAAMTEIARRETREGKDAALDLTLPRDGDYFIVIQEANDLGGPQFGYRLIVK